mmetsp:Transcript_27596/g.43090  ORF Transcript_27596/g.43090 Transcript_27596/m.43090 type:complete len:310 (+) Transcript_27596:79-1008(+)
MDEAFAAEINQDWGDREAEAQLIGLVPGFIIGVGGLARLPALGWQQGWNDPAGAPWALRPRPTERAPALYHRIGAAFPGLLNGIVRAIAGLVARPIAGALDSVSVTSASIIFRWGADAGRGRVVRPPRNFGLDKALKPVVYRQAHAAHLLNKVEEGKFGMGFIVDVFELLDSTQLLITHLELVCVHPSSPRNALWHLRLSEVISAEVLSDSERGELTRGYAARTDEDGFMHLFAGADGVVVAISGIRSDSSGALDWSRAGAFETGGCLATRLVLCSSEQNASRLQRLIVQLSELYNSKTTDRNALGFRV